jgi:hypothetical protein
MAIGGGRMVQAGRGEPPFITSFFGRGSEKEIKKRS